jgi:hypothetical protein
MYSKHNNSIENHPVAQCKLEKTGLAMGRDQESCIPEQVKAK